jgi:hypothetical protein
MDAERIDGIAKRVGTRRGFVAGAVALAGLLWRRERAGAYGFCSKVGGFCVPAVPCCAGTACTFEYNPWVGRCGTLKTDGTIEPPPPLTTAEVEKKRASGARAKQRRRRKDRRAYRRRRKKGRLKKNG